jgi:hypothetical protein
MLVPAHLFFFGNFVSTHLISNLNPQAIKTATSTSVFPALAYSGIFLPTAGTEPPATGSGLPDRLDRLPVKTGQTQI